VRLLLDTCTFLWIVSGSAQLSKRAVQEFSDPNNEVFLSVVSAWEIAVKYSLGTLRLPRPPLEYVVSQREAHAITPLSLSEDEALYLPKLPKYHRDPFDRMLVCQAVAGGLAILSPDPLISQYPIRTLW
jgi:PIN domain nuclease of toxin-antitoxin system